jgi:hypothetical protein
MLCEVKYATWSYRREHSAAKPLQHVAHDLARGGGGAKVRLSVFSASLAVVMETRLE